SDADREPDERDVRRFRPGHPVRDLTRRCAGPRTGRRAEAEPVGGTRLRHPRPRCTRTSRAPLRIALTASLMITQPFRFGVQATKAGSRREWLDLARKVEDLGYSTLFVTDHYLGRGPASRECNLPPQHLAPIAAMASAAAVTETLRI